jgi:hypothetical protein
MDIKKMVNIANKKEINDIAAVNKIKGSQRIPSGPPFNAVKNGYGQKYQMPRVQ